MTSDTENPVFEHLRRIRVERIGRRLDLVEAP
jgi:hypothetical protein